MAGQKNNIVMITFSILILIVAKALPVLNTKIYSTHVTRITTIVFLFAAALTLNILNLENIGSGIGVYSGLFQVTTISQLIEIFLFVIGGGILMAWPQKKHNLSFPAFGSQNELDLPLAVYDRTLISLPRLRRENFSKIEPKKETMLDVSAIEDQSTCYSLPLLKVSKRESLSPKERGVFSKEDIKKIFKEQQALKLTSLKAGDTSGTDYSLIVLFSSLGSSLLISSYDLISIYLSIELQSFGLYVLSTLYRDSESATSAGLKYFLLGGLSSCIILLGTGIIYSYTGTTNLESLYIINSVIDINQQYIIQGISLGLSLIFIGFLFKIAAAPLHNWSPDVYDGTPTIVTTWLTIIPKIAILFILLELQVKLGIFGPLGDGLKTIIVNNSGYLLNLNQGAINEFISLIFTTSNPSLEGGALFEEGVQKSKEISIVINNNILKTLLLISATLSLIIGSLLGLAQIRIKRLLAYSTISHIGFILLALAVNTEQSIDSFIFYIIQYTITNLNIFLVILGLAYCLNNNTYLSDGGEGGVSLLGECQTGRGKGEESNNIRFTPLLWRGANKDISFISEFKGLFFSNPLLSISFAVSLFSMAGIPPLIGFFSKQLVLYSALQNGYYSISVLAIIVSVISCSYYLQIIKLLFTPSPDFGSASDSNNGQVNGRSQSPLPLPVWPLSLSKGEERAAKREIEKIKAKGGEYASTTLPLALQRRGGEIIITNTHSYLISTLTFTILLFFIKPSLILNSTQLLSLSLFYI